MNVGRSLILGTLLSVTSFAANPFLGTWVYNAEKSPKPPVRYAIRDLGENRFLFTGPAGIPVAVKADGIPVESPAGGEISFRKLDDRNWEMTRTEPETIVTTFNLTPDDKVLTVVDMIGQPGESVRKEIAHLSRASRGLALGGEWKSFLIERKQLGAARKLIIEPYGTEGLTLIDRDRVDLNFDGKLYVNPAMSRPVAISGKRMNPRAIRMAVFVDGKLDEKNEYSVSEDGETLTIVTKPAKSSAIVANIYDRR